MRPRCALLPSTPATCVIANSVASDVGDVAHARLHERDERLAALQPVDHAGRRAVGIDVLLLVAPDEPLRQALGRRETIQASTKAIATYATVRHGSGRNSS